MITQFAQYRRNIARNKKLEEQFNKADTNGNCKITSKQMRKIFEDNHSFLDNLINKEFGMKIKYLADDSDEKVGMWIENA